MEKLLSLGIDWQSIIIYLVNFGILFVVISKYLLPKIIGYLDERQKTIASNLEEANKLKNEFHAKLEEIKSEQEESRLEQAQQMQDLKKELEQKRLELTEEIEAERLKLLSQAEQDISERKSMLIKEVEEQMLGIVQKMVLFIVQNKLPKEVIAQSVDEAWKEYKK